MPDYCYITYILNHYLAKFYKYCSVVINCAAQRLTALDIVV